MDSTCTLELDWAHDTNHAGDTKSLARKHNLKVTLLQEFGPAGGNPLYQFSGERHRLVALLDDYSQGDEDEIEFLEEHIQEV